MREEFIHFIWLYRLFDHTNLVTDEFEPLQIIYPGNHNFDSGPDFSNARIRIGDKLWAGNVEIHIRTSDWFNHNHHLDPAYNNVILHVVYDNDLRLSNSQKVLTLPTLKLKGRIDLNKYLHWQKLINRPDWIPCKSQFNKVPEIIKLQAIEWMAIERLERKTLRVDNLLERSKGNWETTLLLLLTRSLGAKTNSEAFEVLAGLVPLNLIKKLKGKTCQIEALVFGLSGLLLNAPEDDYTNELKKEYDFLKRKYNLTEMQAAHWKFMRMRPANFPTLRLAQLARILNDWEQLTKLLFYTSRSKKFDKILQQAINPYWEIHYRFGKKSEVKASKMGKTMVNNIVINAVVPFLYAYGKAHANAEIKESAVTVLQQTPAEKNNIIKGWKALNVESQNAFETQGLIELKNQFCAFKKCLTCKIGAWTISKYKNDDATHT